MRYRWYYIYEDHYFQLKKELQDNPNINPLLKQNILTILNTGVQVPGVFVVDLPYTSKQYCKTKLGKYKEVYGINYEINLNDCFDLFTKDSAYEVITWFYVHLLTYKEFYIFPSTVKIVSKVHEQLLHDFDQHVDEFN